MTINPLNFESLSMLLSIKETRLLLKALEFYAHELGHIEKDGAIFPLSSDAKDLHFYLSGELDVFMEEHQDRWNIERQEREDSKSLSESQPLPPLAAALPPLVESLMKVAAFSADFSPPTAHRLASIARDVEINEEFEEGDYLLLSGTGSILAISGNSEFDDGDNPPTESGTVVRVVGNRGEK